MSEIWTTFFSPIKPGSLLETTVEETKPKEKSRKIKDELQKWKYKTKNGNNQAVVPFVPTLSFQSFYVQS
jgi:acyl dehydratase